MKAELDRAERQEKQAHLLLWGGLIVGLTGFSLLFAAFFGQTRLSEPVRTRTPYAQVKYGTPGLQAALADVGQRPPVLGWGAGLTLLGGIGCWLSGQMNRKPKS